VDEAYKWLELAYAGHDTSLRGVKTDRLFSNLHGDPRWPAFLQKMGLVDAPETSH
jgi:hypothetical protein